MKRTLADIAISADLPWTKPGPFAVTQTGLHGRVAWCILRDMHQLVDYVAAAARGNQVLVLLDIPIRGVNRLLANGEHWRPIDSALTKSGIPLLPSSKAGNRGLELMKSICQASGIGTQQVKEIYPYAIYKVLDYLRERNALNQINAPDRRSLLDDSFIPYWPVKYKRVSGKRRTVGLRALHGFLTHSNLGITFPDGLPSPDDGNRLALKLLTDIYDAVLGAVLGLLLLRGSPLAVEKGDPQLGDMALLADVWLSAQIAQRLPQEEIS